MLEIPPYMGVNAPKEHQRVIAKLTAGLYWLFAQGKIPYEPFPEVMIDAAKTSPTPDVLLYDNVRSRNVVIIEVAADGWKKDFRKVMELVEDYEVDEGFVYNYQTNSWLKYSRQRGEVTDAPSFCDAIGHDLADFVK